MRPNHPSPRAFRKKTLAYRVIAGAFLALAAPALASCAVSGGEKAAATPRTDEPSMAAKSEGEAAIPAPTSPSLEGPVTIEQATAAIDQSEHDIDQAVAMIAQSSARSAQKPAEAPSTGPGVPPPPPQATAAPMGGATELGAGEGCFSACRALASMRRSVDHLCGLTGDSDARCEGARTRVNGATARVHATCPACS